MHRVDAEELLKTRSDIESALPAVEDILLFVRRKNRLSKDEWEDFRSWTWLKLVESDYAAIRKFDGRGSLRAFLAVVLGRFLLDYRVQKWGKWRPSAKAKTLGPYAVELERLIQRESYSVSQAVQTVATHRACPLDEQELHDLAAKLPLRRKNRTCAEDWIEEVACPRPSPERQMVLREAEDVVSRIEGALTRALAQLGVEERLSLKMRFEQGMKLNEVARALGRDPKPFYRQFDRSLNRLRCAMCVEGIATEQLELAFPERQWREFVNSSRP